MLIIQICDHITKPTIKPAEQPRSERRIFIVGRFEKRRLFVVIARIRIDKIFEHFRCIQPIVCGGTCVEKDCTINCVTIWYYLLNIIEKQAIVEKPNASCVSIHRLSGDILISLCCDTGIIMVGQKCWEKRDMNSISATTFDGAVSGDTAAEICLIDVWLIELGDKKLRQNLWRRNAKASIAAQID